MTTLHGLDTCDTTRKARAWLTRFEIPHEFIDLRAQRPTPEQFKQWATALGGWEVLINRQSTTWRQLPMSRKTPQSDPEWTLLLREHPTLVKRPLMITPDGVTSVGFSDASFKRRFGR